MQTRLVIFEQYQHNYYDAFSQCVEKYKLINNVTKTFDTK